MSSRALASALRYAITVATLLFFVFPPSVFELIGWHYLGGGAEFEKIHLATYLLVATTACLWLVDPNFRRDLTLLCLTDWRLIFFACAVACTAGYAVLVKQLSIAPFIDTFFAAILVIVVWICLPYENLKKLRFLLDAYFVANIAILFFEYATKTLVIGSVAPDSYEFGQFRARGLFEGQLSAATMLGVYCIANLVSTPVRLSRECMIRLALGVASFAAIFTTGGRTAVMVTLFILLLYLAISSVRQIATGRLNGAAIVYAILSMPVLALGVFAMQQLGFLDTMLSRFEYDIGSASTRQIAIDLVANMPGAELWFGLSPRELGALALRQVELNLLAIEISWANFILSCGLIITIPLFLSYVVFLFGFIPYYSGPWAMLPSLFLLIVTAASNGIWAKTTVLTMSFAIILAFFRRPDGEHG